MVNWFKRKKKAQPEPQRETDSEQDNQQQEVDLEDSRQTPIETVTETQVEPSGQENTSEFITSSEEQESALPEMTAVEDEASDDLLDAGEEEGEEPEQKKGRFFRRLRDRLHKTREQFVSRVDRLVLGKKTIDADLMDELEEVLITSDLGVRTTQLLLQKVAERIKRQELKDPSKLREQLRDEIEAILSVPAPAWDLQANHPFMVMVIGVNGVGKTTTIGKLAHLLKKKGLKVMLGAADTFRAAAVEQLSLWGERVDVPVIKQKSGSDPSAVAFDVVDAAVARNMDVVLLDTAGRMHTKVNLMEELKKVQRVMSKKIPSAPHEILLVLDATTGQNALSQARLFKEAIGVTGLILTKLDGTAKGGIIVAICEELQVPVRYIGIGESMEDLRPFDPEEFTKALF
jgi:fused signal recognition particle receptor